MKGSTEPKPCPSCGSPNPCICLLPSEDWKWMDWCVWCEKCDHSGKHAATASKAIMLWNEEGRCGMTGFNAAPLRNCDIYGWRDAWEKWRTENHPKKPVTYKDAYDSTAAFMDWFMGTAEEGGAA